MKFVCIAILTFLITTSHAQIKNYSIDSNKLVWSITIESDLDADQIYLLMKKSAEFENLEIDSGIIFGEFFNRSFDYSGAGYSEVTTPIYLARKNATGKIIVEFSAGQYTITIKSIQLTQSYSAQLSGQGEPINIEKYVLKKRNSEFKNSFSKKPSKIINFTFEQMTNW